MVVKKETSVDKPGGRKKLMDFTAKGVMESRTAKRRAEKKRNVPKTIR